LPTELYRWAVEKRPKPLGYAAKLADEYAVLYKPLKFDQANSPKSENETFMAKTHKHVGRGNSQENFKAKRVRRQTLSLLLKIGQHQLSLA